MIFLKIAISFTIIVFLIQKKIGPGISLIIGAILLGLIYPFKLDYLIKIFYKTLTLKDSIELIITLILIYFLSNILKEKEILSKMINNLDGIFPNRKITIFLSSMLIGLLPMPGGALFSAPLVDGLTKDINTTNERKAYMNYWFRHVLEGAFPTYPGIILAAKFLNVSIRNALLAHIFIPIVLIFVGIFIGFKGINVLDSNNKNGSFKKFLIYFSPILVILILILIFNFEAMYAIGISLILSIIFLKPRIKDLIYFTKKSVTLDNIFLPIGVYFFRNLLELGVANEISINLSYLKISPLLIIFFMPFLGAFLTGLTSMGVAISYPIILNLFYPNGFLSFALMGLAYSGAVLGILFSPLHLCLIVTIEYFKCELAKIYKTLSISVSISSIILIFIYALLFRLKF
jgi:integral membrane protein (TIGR00529 family)